MKFFGHPIHLMLIHFPAALFPVELVFYFVSYQTGDTSFANASFLMICAGVAGGWLSIITGAIDLIMIKDAGALQANALIHGTVNATVVLAYSLIALVLNTTKISITHSHLPILAQLFLYNRKRNL